jgi:hypothetical protein
VMMSHDFPNLRLIVLGCGLVLLFVGNLGLIVLGCGLVLLFEGLPFRPLLCLFFTHVSSNPSFWSNCQFDVVMTYLLLCHFDDH